MYSFSPAMAQQVWDNASTRILTRILISPLSKVEWKHGCAISVSRWDKLRLQLLFMSDMSILFGL